MMTRVVKCQNLRVSAPWTAAGVPVTAQFSCIMHIKYVYGTSILWQPDKFIIKLAPVLLRATKLKYEVTHPR